jgi:hypothetical protein
MDPALKRYKMIEEFYHIFDQWLTLMEDGIGIDTILERKGYYKIAVWGMGTMAIHFLKALEHSKVSVEYAVDKSATEYYVNVKVISKDKVYDHVDAIVYTNPNENLEEIQDVADRLNCDVVSLADVIFDNMK